MSDDGSELAADRIQVARRWLAVADLDVRSAHACLAAQPPIPETGAYRCQQAAKKLMKALLVLAQIPFRRTHDMEVLRDLVVPRYPDLAISIDRLVPLTDWGTVFRYPDMDSESAPSSDELRDVLNELHRLAELVLSRIESVQPP